MKEHSDYDIVLFQNHTQVFENTSHLKYLVRKQKHSQKSWRQLIEHENSKYFVYFNDFEYSLQQ